MNFIHGMPMATYRELPGVSFHQLRDFAKSPLLFYRKHIQKCIPDWSSDAMTFGACVHALTLEGQAAFDAVCVKAPDKFVTESGAVSKSKDAKAWAAEQDGKIILSPSDYVLAILLAGKVHANMRAHELLSKGQPEVVSQWKHQTGLDCRARADWLHNDYVVDLKTCASLDDFPSDAMNYAYPQQCAFYCDSFQRSQAFLIAVEKQEPNRCGIWRVGPHALQEGRIANATSLGLLAVAQETDCWRGDPIDEQLLEIEPTAATLQFIQGNK